jgi:uncharacterized protein (DUF433 family)
MTDEELIARYIEQDPHKSGRDEARLVDHFVHVWALVGHYHAVDCDVDRVAADYHLPREAVEAALAYYRRHKAIIDNRLEANVA